MQQTKCFMESKTDILNSCLAEFRKMPEANVLMHYLSRENRFSFDDRISITRSMETAFSPMFLDMKSESQSLSESDLIYCALVAAGFSPVVIADCLSSRKNSHSVGLNCFSRSKIVTIMLRNIILRPKRPPYFCSKTN